MMKTNHKRLLTLILALVLVFGLSVGAYASWVSFQNDSSNNGRITVEPPTSGSATSTPVQLPTNDPDGTVYTGVDAASVIAGDYVYTLYNGGVTSGSLGGARMQATELATGNSFWNLQLDSDASNQMLLSTPYYDTNSDTVYAAVIYPTLFDSFSSLSGWTTSGNVTIDNSGVATFNGQGSVSTTIALSESAHSSVQTIYLPNNITPNWASNPAAYTVTLNDGNTTYTLLNGSTADVYDEYTDRYTYDGAAIPYGTYTLTVTVTPSVNQTATFSSIDLYRQDWRLYAISDADQSNAQCSSAPIATGEGQINTPINVANGYLYFGSWRGDHAYYQYGPINGTPTLMKFTPGGYENFYWAGAAQVGDNVVFGSDSGKIYIRPIGSNFNSVNSGSVIDLATYETNCGRIRSSICVVGSDWYLTSYGSSRVDSTVPSSYYSYLWKITNGTDSNPTVEYLVLPEKSTSTPVVSSNNYIYLGFSHKEQFYTTGGVFVAPVNFPSNPWVKTIYSGQPVQASPIVYSKSVIDYIYFTTNHQEGAGFCYMWNTNAPSSSGVQIWKKDGTGSITDYERAAAQGFAASNSGTSSYLVYGDDGNHIYIIH